MSRLGIIEPVGILKAWTAKVLMKRARTTATTTDSRYSRATDLRKGGGSDGSLIPYILTELRRPAPEGPTGLRSEALQHPAEHALERRRLGHLPLRGEATHEGGEEAREHGAGLVALDAGGLSELAHHVRPEHVRELARRDRLVG